MVDIWLTVVVRWHSSTILSFLVLHWFQPQVSLLPCFNKYQLYFFNLRKTYFSVIAAKLQQCFQRQCWIRPLGSPTLPPAVTVPHPTAKVTLIVCDSSISLLPCIYSTFLPLYYRAMNYLDNRCLHQVMDCFFPYPLDPTAIVLRSHFCHTQKKKNTHKAQTLFHLFFYLLLEFSPFVLS